VAVGVGKGDWMTAEEVVASEVEGVAVSVMRVAWLVTGVRTW